MASSSDRGFVVSDQTILAIVQGMQRYGLLPETYDDEVEVGGKVVTRPVHMGTREAIRYTATALRVVNEYQVADTDTLFRGPDGRWVARVVPHVGVDMRKRGNHTDAEVMQACNCWLGQVRCGKPMDLDFLTVTATVRLLRERVLMGHLADMDFGNEFYQSVDLAS